jgi:hypothetical protein
MSMFDATMAILLGQSEAPRTSIDRTQEACFGDLNTRYARCRSGIVICCDRKSEFTAVRLE